MKTLTWKKMKRKKILNKKLDKLIVYRISYQDRNIVNALNLMQLCRKIRNQTDLWCIKVLIWI